MQLLDHEVHAREQVPLLMEMRRADLALDKAIESGDPQLGKAIDCITYSTRNMIQQKPGGHVLKSRPRQFQCCVFIHCLQCLALQLTVERSMAY